MTPAAPCNHSIALKVNLDGTGLPVGKVVRGSYMRGCRDAPGFFVEVRRMGGRAVYRWIARRYFIPINPKRCDLWGLS